MITDEELDIRFEPPAASDGPSQVLMEAVEPLFKDIARTLDANINDCRELDLALTTLEAAHHWACAATRNMPFAYECDLHLVKRQKPFDDNDAAAIRNAILIMRYVWTAMRDRNELAQANEVHAAIDGLKSVVLKFEEDK